jgi:hypothetical protein
MVSFGGVEDCEEKARERGADVGLLTACASQSITFATAYDSLGEEGVRYIRF